MKIKKIISFLLTLVLGAFLFIGCDAAKEDPSEPMLTFSFGSNNSDYKRVLVKKVFDGDTFLLASGEKVRLIGLDTPELHESDKLFRDSRKSKMEVSKIKLMGKKSYLFTKLMVEGRYVRLEFDTERKDKYNRLLAYAYLQNGTFVNAEILKQGYASMLTVPPNVKYVNDFLKLYKEAKENRRGLWQ